MDPSTDEDDTVLEPTVLAAPDDELTCDLCGRVVPKGEPESSGPIICSICWRENRMVRAKRVTG